MAEMLREKWWAWQGLNLRPLRCQGRATRLFPQKPALFCVLNERTWTERMRNLGWFYRTFTAPPADNAPFTTTLSFPPFQSDRMGKPEGIAR